MRLFHKTCIKNQCWLFVSILDAANVELSLEQKEKINSPGKSVLNYLKTGDQQWSDFQFSEYGNARMIVNQQFKFIQRLTPLKEGFGNEFFDLVADPREEKNQIQNSKYAEDIKLLSDQLNVFFSNYEVEEYSGTNLVNQENPNPVPVWLR